MVRLPIGQPKIIWSQYSGLSSSKWRYPTSPQGMYLVEVEIHNINQDLKSLLVPIPVDVQTGKMRAPYSIPSVSMS